MLDNASLRPTRLCSAAAVAVVLARVSLTERVRLATGVDVAASVLCTALIGVRAGTLVDVSASALPTRLSSNGTLVLVTESLNPTCLFKSGAVVDVTAKANFRLLKAVRLAALETVATRERLTLFEAVSAGAVVVAEANLRPMPLARSGASVEVIAKALETERTRAIVLVSVADKLSSGLLSMVAVPVAVAARVMGVPAPLS